MEAVSEHGISGVHEVDIAIFEVDGNIIILSDNFKKRTEKSVGIGKNT
jgi:uncharacterized membrane protein YcaP (DUF421 family)